MKLQIIDGTPIHSDNTLRVRSRMHGIGTITATFPEKQPDKQMCSGCRDDFYNGHNDIGVKECWMFAKAKVVNKVGYSSIHCSYGPDTIMKNTLSCWHATVK
jgi:hypothetical protein